MAANELQMTPALARNLVQEAVTAAPEECCGLLIGKGTTVFQSKPLTNVAEDPVSGFLAEPKELLHALFRAEEEQLELLAIYHSHPRGDTLPSERDIREANYPEAAQLIVGLGGKEAELAAWRVDGGIVRAVPLRFTDHLEAHPIETEPTRPLLLYLGALITFALTMGLAISALT